MNINFNPKNIVALNKISFSLFVVVVMMSSCASYNKVPYFQDLSKRQITSTDLNNYTPLTIQPEDQIIVNVSSLNPEASAVFNSSSSNTLNSNNNNPATNGYIVDQQGEVNLPLIGKMKVSGLTTAEAAAQLQSRLLTYLRSPSVAIRVVNFKVAVLGDVMRPNVYNSASERLTITEALSMAGDLNITANRDDIILVREQNGKREFIPIDLTSKNLFQSPYFYMKSNDLLVVTPSKLKLASVDNSYQNASILISALSLIAITYSIFR